MKKAKPSVYRVKQLEKLVREGESCIRALTAELAKIQDISNRNFKRIPIEPSVPVRPIRELLGDPAFNDKQRLELIRTLAKYATLSTTQADTISFSNATEMLKEPYTEAHCSGAGMPFTRVKL